MNIERLSAEVKEAVVSAKISAKVSAHHTSLCDRTEKDPLMLTPKKGVIYPVAVARVNGKLTRIFLDTGTGGRYASSTLIQTVNAK